MFKKSVRNNELKKHNIISRKKKLLLSIGTFIVLLLSITIGYLTHLYNKTEEIITESHEEVGREEEKSELRDKPVDPIDHNVSVLFIGLDTGQARSYGEASRSDALLLATFNKKQNTAKLLSIPRDTYVYVPEAGYSTKINHAHFLGGAKATIETVEEFLNVPIDYYVSVNFDAFIEVVDSLNGIYYDVPFEFNEMDSNDNKDAIHLSPGYQLLTGEETLALARSRKYDNDIERGKRQQEIVKRIAEKAASPSSAFKLGDVLESVGGNLKTNLKFDDLKSFLTYGTNKNFSIETINLDGKGGRMNDGLWYFQVNEESQAKIERELRNHLDLPIYIRESSDLANDHDEEIIY
ncbi:transcriptional attenuator, LytR family [Oceanobacillus limi]|uniref:Transcriptional attenuator, LytR family n=1 Tax=Oceanobacillus limi TaxID=930131 RepID=A0A1I0A3L3_9BACI|nr:LCP family protein [Oceanobacillus limi]SES88723.1 transcriptional attenuator, LytR family [Oceanobacillus limi]